MNILSSFFGGLSGETQSVPRPATGGPVLVRRTKMITYSLAGNFRSPQHATVVFKEERDVMR